MSQKWKEVLKRSVGWLIARINSLVNGWNQRVRLQAEHEYRQARFRELTPNEEADIRNGYWEARG